MGSVEWAEAKRGSIARGTYGSLTNERSKVRYILNCPCDVRGNEVGIMIIRMGDLMFHRHVNLEKEALPRRVQSM